MASDKRKSRKKSPRLGKWKVKRVGENQIELTLPKGMVITGEPLSIEDVLKAIANSIPPDAPTLKCCSGNTAIA